MAEIIYFDCKTDKKESICLAVPQNKITDCSADDKKDCYFCQGHGYIEGQCLFRFLKDGQRLNSDYKEIWGKYVSPNDRN